MKKERKRKTHAEAEKKKEDNENFNVLSTDREPVTVSQTCQDEKIVPNFGKKQKFSSDIKKAYKATVNNQKPTESIQENVSTSEPETTVNVERDVLKEINSTGKEVDEDTFNHETTKNVIKNEVDQVGQSSVSFSKTIHVDDDRIVHENNDKCTEAAEIIDNVKENIEVSDNLREGVENQIVVCQSVQINMVVTENIQNIQNICIVQNGTKSSKAELDTNDTNIQNIEDDTNETDQSKDIEMPGVRNEVDDTGISFSPLQCSSPVKQEDGNQSISSEMRTDPVIGSEKSCDSKNQPTCTEVQADMVIGSEKSHDSKNQPTCPEVQADIGVGFQDYGDINGVSNEIEVVSSDKLRDENKENVPKNDVVNLIPTKRQPSTDNTNLDQQASPIESEPESEKSFELEEGDRLPGCNAKETDEITDSQLCSIDWKEDFALPDKCPRKAETSQFQDGTNIVKGLTSELSQLNQMILRTKRELEMARRQFNQSHKTATDQRNARPWNNKTQPSNKTYNRL